MLLGNVSIQDTSINIPLLVGYVLLFAIGSLNEEIMIRGYILSNFCESMNLYIALLASLFLFAVIHLANANVTLLSVINIFLAGILLGIYYIHTRNLWLPISLHFSWNFFQGPVFGFEVSGVDVTGVIIQDIQGSDMVTGEPFGFEGSIIATLLMVISIVLLHYRYQDKK
jgi:membrane protease YdiL (CAAX protease family)